MVVTVIPYRIQEDDLVKWLQENIGKDASGNDLWSKDWVTQDLKEMWIVTAPREITAEEQAAMKQKTASKYLFWNK
ncbi:hypothetical protein MMC25_000914 [Agyrium rufum]|nr:hypothetical protein [Agyrium rufum]